MLDISQGSEYACDVTVFPENSIGKNYENQCYLKVHSCKLKKH